MTTAIVFLDGRKFRIDRIGRGRVRLLSANENFEDMVCYTTTGNWDYDMARLVERVRAPIKELGKLRGLLEDMGS